jgi:hypothetical protein
VTAAMMIILTPNFAHNHSHSAQEQESTAGPPLWRHNCWERIDDERRQKRIELLPALGSGSFTVRVHLCDRLLDARDPLDYVLQASRGQGLC